MIDYIKAHFDAGLEISAIRVFNGETLIVGQDGVESIVPVPVAGESAWKYWLEVRQMGRFAMYNPLHLVSIEYEYE